MRNRRIFAVCPRFLRYLVLALAVAALFTVGACGGDDDSSASGDSADSGGSANACPGASENAEKSDSPLPPPELSELSLGSSTAEVSFLPFLIAEKEGIYEKYGLKVKQTAFEGDSQVAQALVAGEIDAGVGAATPLFSESVDAVVTAIPLVTPTDVLLGGPDVKSADDLRGKQIAMNEAGGDTHQAVFIGLKELGLTLDDVNAVTVGAEPDRIAAVTGGSAAAAVVGVTVAEDLAKERGLNIVVDLTDTDSEYVRYGLYFPTELVENCPNTVLALNAALAEAHEVFFEDLETSAKVMADYLDMPIEDARQQVEDYRPLVANQRCLTPDAGPFETQQAFLEDFRPEAADVDLSDLYTTEFQDKLEQRGFYEDIDAPCPEDGA